MFLVNISASLKIFMTVLRELKPRGLTRFGPRRRQTAKKPQSFLIAELARYEGPPRKSPVSLVLFQCYYERLYKELTA